MDIQFYGANCLTLQSKKTRIVIDDTLESLGAKSILKDGDVALYTSAHGEPKANTKLTLGHPGEYEVSEISIYGIALRAHMDEAGKKEATAYKIHAGDTRILDTGHIYPELTDRQLESIGTIDVLIVPVGGNGYTTDAVGAQKIIKEVEPKTVILTHYHDDSLQFPVPQQTLEQALTTLDMEPAETVSKLKLKASDSSEGLHLVVLNRS